jgi:transcriptional antiterminator NusG
MTNAASSFAPGDPVRLLDGPLASFAGVVREVDAALGELVVDVEMYGRPVPIRTHPWQVALELR